DMAHLLSSWFNRGFLVLRRIDWQTPAAILEKIIKYEAVHEIQGWDDLRRRLDPADRRCFAFFHPSLIDEPLIFVEVALTREIPGNIQDVLTARVTGAGDNGTPTTAVFYSISNCQEGLRGISFGNFLIKQVVEELVREEPQLKTFVTLSPVPRFARWLDRARAEQNGPVTSADRVTLQMLSDPGWIDDEEDAEALQAPLLALAAHYFLVARSPNGKPVDPVARFHLGNGARLERINWMGDVSEKGLREAHGLMVNYLYDLRHIEKNHEAYANEGEVAAARQVRSLLRSQSWNKQKTKAVDTEAPALTDQTQPTDASARKEATAPPEG
ncbi:MAG: malonyl-CoA decarboxylase domain-containing protein, partial [Hyphomicrobiaceae bacterium]